MMPVRVIYRSIAAEFRPGFAYDTPRGCTLVLDPSAAPDQLRAVAAEVLDDDEVAEILIGLALPA